MRQTLLWVSSFILVFVVPWLVPVGGPVLSASYVLGFSNQAAIVGLVIGIALFAVFGAPRSVPDSQAPVSILFRFNPARERLSPLLVLAWFLFAVAMSAILWAITRDGYGEADYFVRRLREMSLGRQPYADFEFAYGPLLLGAPFWLMKHAAPPIGDARNAYCLWHMLLSGLSILLFAWIVDRFDSTRRHKAILFSAIVFLGYNRSLGINGVLVRFLLPFAFLLLAHGTVAPWLNRRTSGFLREAAWVGFCTASFFASASISPEIGLACIPAFVAFSWFRTDGGPVKKTVVSAAAALCMTGAAAVFPFAYYAAVFQLADRAKMFPLLPGPLVLAYWAGILYVVPRLVRAGMSEATGETRSILIGLAVLTTAMMPGAMGCCEWEHVFFYGIPVLIMAPLLVARKLPRWLGYAAALAFLALFVVPAVLSFILYYCPAVSRQLVPGGEQARSVAAFPDESRQGQESPNAARSDYARLDHYGEMLVPFKVSPALERYLRDRGLWRSEYYPDCVQLLFPKQVRTKIRDIEASPFVLVPQFVMDHPPKWSAEDYRDLHRRIRRSLLFPSQWLPTRHEAYDPKLEVAAFIRANFDVVETFGEYVVMKRKLAEAVENTTDAGLP